MQVPVLQLELEVLFARHGVCDTKPEVTASGTPVTVPRGPETSSLESESAESVGTARAGTYLCRLGPQTAGGTVTPSQPEA